MGEPRIRYEDIYLDLMKKEWSSRWRERDRSRNSTQEVQDGEKRMEENEDEGGELKGNLK